MHKWKLCSFFLTSLLTLLHQKYWKQVYQRPWKCRFASLCVDFSAQKIYWLGKWRGYDSLVAEQPVWENEFAETFTLLQSGLLPLEMHSDITYRPEGLVSLCVEPSPPQGITSGLKTHLFISYWAFQCPHFARASDIEFFSLLILFAATVVTDCRKMKYAPSTLKLHAADKWLPPPQKKIKKNRQVKGQREGGGERAGNWH